MHLHLERNAQARCDCAILSLSWMGKVPEDFPEDEGWKLSRANYYQEGWLATGNVRGVVGVTFTASHSKKNIEMPHRTNYNLRGHRSEVTLVRWNEPYQKLASCDSSGIIFVWIKYEGRWSIELINDRNTPVTHFSWSHDGRMALICYQDGFVLVGSVSGQRYWSSMLNLDSTIICGVWTPDDQQVYFGTNGGHLVVMDVHGAMVSQVHLSEDAGITNMAWNCEKFKMEESDNDDTTAGVSGNSSPSGSTRSFILAVSFSNGVIHLMHHFDEVSPLRINTNLQGLCMEWSNSGEVLAVGGCQNTTTSQLFHNTVHFYSPFGFILSTSQIECTQYPVTALTWGHSDKRVFIATGPTIHTAWVTRCIASLQFLCRLQLQRHLKIEAHAHQLPLPTKLSNAVASLFHNTVRSCVPDSSQLRTFASCPPSYGARLHCTMIRHEEDSQLGAGCYTLYLEYLGGLVPLLKGRRTSKIRPEFVIFDPQGTDKSSTNETGNHVCSDSSDSDYEDSCASPRMQRRRHQRKARLRQQQQLVVDGDMSDLIYPDTLPECERLVEVTSNIWGTKFKIHGLTPVLPANLGQVTYKTSLLHLQPRQMALLITELRDDLPLGPEPPFNPNAFSEDESDSGVLLEGEPDGEVVPAEDSPYVEFTLPEHSHPVLLRSSHPHSHLPHTGTSLCCDAGLPQSPKHTVAPTEVLAEVQVSPNDFGGGVHRLKAGLLSNNNSSHNRRSSGGRKIPTTTTAPQENTSRTPTPTTSPAPAVTVVDQLVRSVSVGFLDLVEPQSQTTGDVTQHSHTHPHLVLPSRELPRRLVLISTSRGKRETVNPWPSLRSSRKSRSWDGVEVCLNGNPLPIPDSSFIPHHKIIPPSSNTSSRCTKLIHSNGLYDSVGSTQTTERNMRPPSPVSTPAKPKRAPRSSPSSPATSRRNRSLVSSPIRQLLNSPLLSRRNRNKPKPVDSSDDEVTVSGDEVISGDSFRDLESFQKAQLRQKLRLRRGESSAEGSPFICRRRRQFLLHNKAPLWNENSQVYQLDFGGRVTQESAKNFQIEFRGKQVMQFGRIDGNAYTLDFQYPFSATQAFAVALANVTQRLK